MQGTKRNGYYFSVAAMLAGAVAYPQVAGAVCDCAWADLAPTSVVKTFGPEVYKYTPYGTTGYYGYKAEMAPNGLFGFKSSSAPAMYLDYKPATSTSMTVHWEVCRISYLGVSLSCGTQGSLTTTSTAQVESACDLTGTYSASNSIWDRYIMNTWDIQAHGFTPVTVPTRFSRNL